MKGQHTCCNKEEVKKGVWTTEEDKILFNYVTNHDQFRWSFIPELTGLKRCGKSCRLRWLNYLQPDLKHGNFSEEEIDLIYIVHEKIGNKWAKIARLLPGRTDNEIKNFWNSKLKKRHISDNEHHELSSSTQHHKSSTSVSIHPISILKSSNQPYHHQTSTTFNRNANVNSSKCVLENLHNSTIGSDCFQPKVIMKVHSSVDHNLNQGSPLDKLYTILYPSCSMSTVNLKKEGRHNGHNLDVSSLPRLASSSNTFNMCKIHRFGQLRSILSHNHNQVISPMLKTTSISTYGGPISYQSEDHKQFPFLMPNTYAIQNNGWLNPPLSHNHGYSTTQMLGTSLMNKSGETKLKYLNDPYPLMPSMFNQSSISNVSNDHDLFPSLMYKTSSIPQSERIIPSPLDDPNKIPSPRLNTSSMPLSRWMSSCLSYNHDQILSPMFINTCGGVNSCPLSNDQKCTPCQPGYHITTNSFSMHSNDQAYCSHDPSTIDINDFFNFDIFDDNSMKAQASGLHNDHYYASSEVHAKSSGIDMATSA
uniref:Uncharacterized protein n=1 Tax=Lactuca sativa TaxID=4236 RepID=A0A9R1WQQ4_LACSA|nr:hypothetical protein LSAT_V11C900490620 [Lactuca sativa]